MLSGDFLFGERSILRNGILYLDHYLVRKKIKKYFKTNSGKSFTICHKGIQIVIPLNIPIKKLFIMKRVNLLAILAIAFGLSATMTSCSNEAAVGTDASVMTTASDESQAATVSDAVLSEADQYVTIAANSGYMAAKSIEGTIVVTPTVTITPKDSITFPKTITIDYGTTGFTGKRGNVLTGKMIVVISDRMWKKNSTKSVTFDNFTVNGNKVAGSKVITNNGLNASKEQSFTVVIKDTMTRAEDGKIVIWNSDRTRTRISNGGTTADASDDEYSISGGSNGINAKGVAYIMVITANNPLITYNNYPFFVQGSVTMTTEKRSALMDYGDGTKDNKATVTINGVTKDITLKK